MADYTNYTNKEMQAVTIAKQIKNGQVVTVGTGLPLIGASVAKRVYAPDCHIIVESGLMDCSPVEVPRSVGDLRFMAHCGTIGLTFVSSVLKSTNTSIRKTVSSLSSAVRRSTPMVT